MSDECHGGRGSHPENVSIKTEPDVVRETSGRRNRESCLPKPSPNAKQGFRAHTAPRSMHSIPPKPPAQGLKATLSSYIWPGGSSGKVNDRADQERAGAELANMKAKAQRRGRQLTDVNHRIAGVMAELQTRKQQLRETKAGFDAQLAAQSEEYERRVSNARASFERRQQDIERQARAENKQLKQDQIRAIEERKQLQAVIGQLKQDVTANAQKFNEQLDTVRRQATEQIRLAKLDASQPQAEVAKMSKTCQKYEKEIEILQANVRSMQESQLQSVESTVWAPHAASEIGEELKKIWTGSRQWSQQYSNLSIEQVLEYQFANAAANRLLDRGCTSCPARIFQALRENKRMKKPGKASAMLLMAQATFDIMRNIVAEPFFMFAVQQSAVGGPHMSHIRGICEMLEFIAQGDVAGAEDLRCQFVRALSPQSKNEDKDAASIKDKIDASRDSAVIRWVDLIMTEYQPYLDREQLEPAREQLDMIIRDAAELNTKLWTRKARIEVGSLTSFDNHEYSHQSGYVEAHPLHGRDLEDDPAALNGYETILLCSPVVTAWGNADGEKYDTYRVLKKGIAWLG